MPPALGVRPATCALLRPGLGGSDSPGRRDLHRARETLRQPRPRCVHRALPPASAVRFWRAGVRAPGSLATRIASATIAATVVASPTSTASVGTTEDRRRDRSHRNINACNAIGFTNLPIRPVIDVTSAHADDPKPSRRQCADPQRDPLLVYFEPRKEKVALCSGWNRALTGDIPIGLSCSPAMSQRLTGRPRSSGAT